MSNNTELHQIVMQQAQVIAQLTEQLAASVGAVSPTGAVVPKDYDDTLTGSDLVREHFRRGGGELPCYIDDRSDGKALDDDEVRLVSGYDSIRGRFISNCTWVYAVACADNGRVLTASELLG